MGVPPCLRCSEARCQCCQCAEMMYMRCVRHDRRDQRLQLNTATLLPVVYEELGKLAAAKLSHEGLSRGFECHDLSSLWTSDQFAGDSPLGKRKRQGVARTPKISLCRFRRKSCFMKMQRSPTDCRSKRFHSARLHNQLNTSQWRVRVVGNPRGANNERRRMR